MKIKRIRERKDAQEESRKSHFFPQRTQDIIRSFFISYDYDGIFQIEKQTFSQTFEYKDISFSKAQYEIQENIFIRWVNLLNSLSADMHISVTNLSKSVPIENYKKDYYFDNDEFPVLTDEFNKLIESSLGKDSIKIENKRYITFTVKAEDYDEARSKLMNIQMDMEKKFNSLTSSLRKIRTGERFSIIYDFLSGDPDDHLFSRDCPDLDALEEKLKKEKCDIYDALTPKSDTDFSSPRYFQINGKYFRVLFVKELPNSLTPRFYHDLQMEDMDKIISMNIRGIPNTKALKQVKKTLGGVKSNRLDKIKRAFKNGYSYTDFPDEELEERLQDTLQLRAAIKKKKQKIFESNMLICIKAESPDELKTRTDSIMNIAAEHLVEIGFLNMMQIEGLRHVLPLGHYSIPLKRSLTSEATAVNVPFNTCDMLHKKSIWFGTNIVTKNGIFIDRKKMVSGNAVVLASTGAGKSFIVKSMCEQIRIRYPEDEIIICDFQKEYSNMVNELKGQVIDISLNSNTYLNPMDISVEYDEEDPIKAKAEYMLAFYESIVGNGNLTEAAKSIIDRCVNSVLMKYEESGFQNKELQPLLTDLVDEIARQPEIQAKELVLISERYTKGSLNIFAKPTNVDIKNKVVSFCLKEVPPSIRTTAYLVLMEHIKNRVAYNFARGVWTWIVFDEGHYLLSNSYSSHYTNENYKTLRKFFGLPVFITQNCRSVVENPDGRDMLANSDMIIILRQKRKDLEVLQNLYDLSDDESDHVLNSDPGHGLIIADKNKILFKNEVPEDYYIYQINKTSKDHRNTDM